MADDFDWKNWGETWLARLDVGTIERLDRLLEAIECATAKGADAEAATTIEDHLRDHPGQVRSALLTGLAAARLSASFLALRAERRAQQSAAVNWPCPVHGEDCEGGPKMIEIPGFILNLVSRATRENLVDDVIWWLREKQGLQQLADRVEGGEMATDLAERDAPQDDKCH